MAVINSAGTAMTLCLFRAVENTPTHCDYINIRDKWLLCQTCRVIYRVELSADRREMDRAFRPLTVSSSESENDDITDDSPPLIDLAEEDTSVGSCPYDQDINIDTSDDEEHAGEQAPDDDFDYERVYGPISSRFLANPFFGASNEDEDETCKDAATQTEAEEDSFDAATQTETEEDDTQVDD